jgi:hypothetical protein
LAFWTANSFTPCSPGPSEVGGNKLVPNEGHWLAGLPDELQWQSFTFFL